MLSKDEKDFFRAHGYIVVRNLIGEKLLQSLTREYADRMRHLVDRWIEQGLLDPAAAKMDFKGQLITSYEAGLDYFQPLDISLPFNDLKAQTPMHTGPAVFDLMVAEPLLDVVESLIGPEIVSNPIQHVRLKPPSRVLDADEHRAHVASTAWHQDRGVAHAVADETHMITAWVAVTEADQDNGCLEVLEDTNAGPLITHCPAKQLEIPEELLDTGDAKPLEVGPGDVIFFHPLTIHGSRANVSERLRWSFDLRYNRTKEPTGRPWFPDFVARSRARPETELRDAKQWQKMWADARSRLAGGEFTPHRWNGKAAVCA